MSNEYCVSRAQVECRWPAVRVSAATRPCRWPHSPRRGAEPPPGCRSTGRSGKGNSNSHGARPVHQIIAMIQWIRTSRLPIKNSLSAARESHFSIQTRLVAPSMKTQLVAPSFTSGHELCSGSEAGSYLRLTDSCITQLKAQGPSRTCNESKEEECEGAGRPPRHVSPEGTRGAWAVRETSPRSRSAIPSSSSLLLSSLELSDTKVYEP